MVKSHPANHAVPETLWCSTLIFCMAFSCRQRPPSAAASYRARIA